VSIYNIVSKYQKLENDESKQRFQTPTQHEHIDTANVNLQRDQGHLLACTCPKVHQCLDLQPFEQPILCKPFQEHQFPIPLVHTHSQSINSNGYPLLILN
jgi:hypothetical protein